MVTWDNIPQQHTRYLSACIATNYNVEFNFIHYWQCDTPSHREGLIFRQTLTWIPAATRLTVKATGHFNKSGYCDIISASVPRYAERQTFGDGEWVYSKVLHTGGYSLCHVTDLVLTFPRNVAYFTILSVSLSNEIYGSNTKWFQPKKATRQLVLHPLRHCVCVCAWNMSNMKVCPSYYVVFYLSHTS